MNKSLKLFISALIGGLCIGLGGTVYLSAVVMGNNTVYPELFKVIGSFLFATGLFTICTYGYSLFTGKIGYLVDNKPKYLIDLGIILAGNFLGVVLFAVLMIYTRNGEGLTAVAKGLVEVKEKDTYASLFLLSIPCGFLMHFAVYTYRKLEENYVARTFSIFLAVVIFIICGFEHVIANLFYITIAKAWSFSLIIPLILMLLGNSLGSFVIPLYEKIRNK